jgi:hypothetical protein
VNTEFENENDVDVDIRAIEFANNSGQKNVKEQAFTVDCAQGAVMLLNGEPAGETSEGEDSVVDFGIYLEGTEYTVEIEVGGKTRVEILVALAVQLKSLAGAAGYTIDPVVYGHGLYVIVECGGVVAGSDDDGLGVVSTFMGSEYYPNLARFEAAVQSWIASRMGCMVSGTSTQIQGIHVYMPMQQ